MNHYCSFLTPDGSVVEIDADSPLWNEPLSIYEKLMLQNNERVFLRIGDENVDCTFLKQGTRTDLIAKKESLLKNASLSLLVLSEIASTSNVLVYPSLQKTPASTVLIPNVELLGQGADSSVTCGHTSSISFSQSLSSEPTPSKVRRKTVVQVGVKNVFSSVQSTICLLSVENNDYHFVFVMT